MKSILFLKIMFFVALGLLGQQVSTDNKEVQVKGKIWLANDPAVIELKNFKSENTFTNFISTENIYARLFINKTLSEVYNELGYKYEFAKAANDYNYALRIYADEKLMVQWLDEMNEQDFNYATTKAYVLSDGDIQKREKWNNLVDEWNTMLSKLEKGDHTIRIEMVPLNRKNAGEDLPVLASGKFDLFVNGELLPGVKADQTAELPKSTLDSPQLEEMILEASKALFENAIPLKVIITDVKGGWTYSKDKLGNIMGRQIVASVIYAFPAEEECFVKSALFHQSHQGNGVYDDPLLVKKVPGYYDYQIDCAKLKTQE
jgi:hypothetical protein